MKAKIVRLRGSFAYKYYALEVNGLYLKLTSDAYSILSSGDDNRAGNTLGLTRRAYYFFKELEEKLNDR